MRIEQRKLYSFVAIERTVKFALAKLRSYPHNRDTREREMVAMRWGMVPYFAKSLADFKGLSTINAKAVTLLSKPLWRVPFHRRRCLIPADGFYEGMRPESRPDDCPAWPHDRTCRPIGSTLGGQAGW